jgi:hypothetical protein
LKEIDKLLSVGISTAILVFGVKQSDSNLPADVHWPSFYVTVTRRCGGVHHCRYPRLKELKLMINTTVHETYNRKLMTLFLVELYSSRRW